MKTYAYYVKQLNGYNSFVLDQQTGYLLVINNALTPEFCREINPDNENAAAELVGAELNIYDLVTTCNIVKGTLRDIADGTTGIFLISAYDDPYELAYYDAIPEDRYINVSEYNLNGETYIVGKNCDFETVSDLYNELAEYIDEAPESLKKIADYYIYDIDNAFVKKGYRGWVYGA